MKFSWIFKIYGLTETCGGHMKSVATNENIYCGMKTNPGSKTKLVQEDEKGFGEVRII